MIDRLVPSAALLTLRELDLSRVALSSTLAPDGQLGPVGGMAEKLRAVRGLGSNIDLLLVSEGQGELPPVLQPGSADPLQVRRACSLLHAIEICSEEARPRQAILKAVSSTFDLLTGAVPYETHYQQLPLLLPAEPDRLPREKKERSEDPWGELRRSDILRWEQETRQEPTGDRPVRLQDLIQRFPQLVTKSRSNVPRFVLLGPPGAGKSTVLGYLRHLCRDTERPLLQQNPRLVPVLVKLPEWQRSAAKYGSSLPEYLAGELYRDIAHAPSADLWRQWMARGQVLLLLDGLDETNASDEFRTRGLKPLLEGEAFRACPLVIACRTVSFEEHRWLGRDLPVFTLAPLELRQQAEFIRKYPEDEQRPFDREALIQELRRQPGLRPLAANPQLLNTICYVVSSSGEKELPTTRGDLYDRAITELLKSKDRKPELASGLMVSRKRRLMEEAALKLWLAGAERRQLVFSEEEVLSALTEAAGGNEDRAEAVLNDVCANSGLLRGQEGGSYSFLHLTLHEFLAACALARRANADGLSAEIMMGSGERPSLRELVLQRAYDPAWREVLPLLANRMQQPQALLNLFAGQLDVDPFHVLLLTGGRCLAEAQPELVSSNTSVVFTRWLTALLVGSPLPRNAEYVQAISILEGLIRRFTQSINLHEPVLLEWVAVTVADSIYDPSDGPFTPTSVIGSRTEVFPDESIDEVADQGESQSTRRVLDWLEEGGTYRDLMEASYLEMGLRYRVLWLSELARLVKQADSTWTRRHLVERLGALGDPSAEDVLLSEDSFTSTMQRMLDGGHVDEPVLFEQQGSHDDIVTAATAKLERVANLVIAELCRWASDPDPVVRHVALKVLIQTQDTRALDVLCECLRHHERETRALAAEALGRLGDRRAVPHLVHCTNGDHAIPQAAVALGLIGDRSIAPVLVKALQSPDLRYWALEGLAFLGDASTSTATAHWLADDDPLVRLQAISALSKMGAAGDVAMVGLMARLEDESESDYIRREAAKALGEARCTSCIGVLISRLEDVLLFDDIAERSLLHIAAASIPARYEVTTGLSNLWMQHHDDRMSHWLYHLICRIVHAFHECLPSSMQSQLQLITDYTLLSNLVNAVESLPKQPELSSEIHQLARRVQAHLAIGAEISQWHALIAAQR